MEDHFLKYYEQELTYIREMGVEFAKKYPKVAGRLLLESDKSEDPHTERLIEAFAFLCGRIHQKIDDDFPEIINSLFSIIYPHYISPIPSCSVVQFQPITANVPEVGYGIPAGAKLLTQQVDGMSCTFTTSMETQLWPIEILSAKIEDPPELKNGAQTAIHLQLKLLNNFSVADLEWKSLRFFINGQSHHTFYLYELLMNNVCHVECEIEGKRKGTETLDLGSECITPVGFEKDESLFPHTSRSFAGYHLLLEYFCFPEKYLFFDLNNLDKLKRLGTQTNISLWLHLNTFPKNRIVVDRDTFCLNATTIVNLFKKIAEPIRVEQNKTEYPVVPSLRKFQAHEVYSVDKVSAITGDAENQLVELKPFYSIRHHLGEEKGRSIFWHMHRKNSVRQQDHGTDVSLSFVDLAFKATDPDYQVWTAHITCNNRDLPARLPIGQGKSDFTMEIAAPIQGIKCLLKPTETKRPDLDGSLQWKLISHFSLNYLSIVQEGESALKEILTLYNFASSASTRQQIQGVISLKSEHITRRIGPSLCRGVKVKLELDEDYFIGSGLFLFASVLERFFGQYVTINSFVQMVLINHRTHEVLKTWPPRSGEQRLL